MEVDLVRAEIAALEAQRCAALLAGDIAALGSLLSDDLVHIHGSSVIDNRDAYLKKVAEDFDFHSIERGELNFRNYGEVVIVTGPLRQTISLRGSSERIELKGSTTQTWIRTPKGWLQNTCHNNFVKTG